jgi:hypothetical protein
MTRKRRTLRDNNATEQQRPPDSLGQALIHLLWPVKPLWRNLLLVLAALLIGGFLLWNTLPDATKAKVFSSLFNKKAAQTELRPEQIKDRDFYVAMGDDSLIGNPKQALSYYQKALDIDPQNQELRQKADSLMQKLSGESK